MYFPNFVIISPWKKEGAFIWTNLNSLHPKMIVPIFVEICPVVLEKKILKICEFIFAFCNYLPLEKGVAIHLNKLESPSPKNLVPSFVENGPVVLEKKMKMWKVYDKDDNGQQTNFDQKSSLQPSAQVS